jgi:CxxC motif-containing protein (DUF1111 family)
VDRPLPLEAVPRRQTRHIGIAAAALLAVGAAAAVSAFSLVLRRGGEPVPASAPTLGNRPGGDTTVAPERQPTLVRPAANLDDEQKARFYAGKALATQPWVRAPTRTDARDGLGPLYNAHSCLSCHVKGGRGQTTKSESEPAVATLVRVSLPGKDAHGGPLPDPVYGAQIQPRSTSLAHQLADRPGAEEYRGDAPVAEADTSIRWKTQPFTYPEGASIELRAPEVVLSNLGYGDLDPHARTGLRHAPSLAGVGLLELVSQADLEALADPDDRDGDGISGRINMVWDPATATMRPGRFGLKANQPSVRVQVAAAFAGDMGISSALFPGQPCTAMQARCNTEPTGNDADGHEISAELLEAVVFFNMSMGVPERRKPDHPLVVRGGETFRELGCDGCHTARYRTGSDPGYPHLSGQDIAPYTDLLLHDMGEALADDREDYEATGSEWRTAPLWGVGLAQSVDASVGFLHDGRARSLEEAILWHGGEAAPSRDSFARLSVEDRRAVLAFVRSL